MSSTDLIAQEQAFLAELRKDGAFQGAVTIRSSILKTPKMKLGNAMSKYVKAQAAKIGDFYCDIRDENYGPKVTIIPLIVSESASLMEKGTDNVLCSSGDLMTNRNGIACKNCPHNSYWNDWGTKEEPRVPICKTSIDVICLVKPEGQEIDPRPLSMSFRKNAYKAGKQLINYIGNDKTGLPFGSKYIISSKTETSGSNDYVVPSTVMEKKSMSMEEIRMVSSIAKEVLAKKKAGHLQEEDYETESFSRSAPQSHTSEAPPIEDDDLPI